MAVFEQRALDQDDAAAERFRGRTKERHRRIELVRTPGGLARADSPERIAKRLDRLSRYYAGEPLPTTPAEAPRAAADEVFAAALDREPMQAISAEAAAAEAGVEAAGTVLERVINTADFVDIRYLEGGVAAARAVVRVDIRDAAGRRQGYGTGSLASPRLLLTNHHVFPAADVAGWSAVEFNYQDGLDGRPLQPRVFGLDPDTFFLADHEHDFALVAVRASDSELAEFGFNPLIEAEGKAVVGEFVTIIQHPGGEKKQVSLRENRIVDMLDEFLHYEADTEPGSSGSPVFNDQWEVVGLHHASVTAPDHSELGGFMNEGIRISAILRFVHAQDLAPDARALADQLIGPERIAVPTPSERATVAAATPDPPPLPVGVPAGPGDVVLPLELVLRIGGGAPAATVIGATTTAKSEAVVIDPDYANRLGYDPAFLGDGTLAVPLPTLSAEMIAAAAVMTTPTSSPPYVLPYHHYSVVLNKVRRLAFFTAVNIDGALHHREDDALARGDDKWFFDPRIPEDQQTGEAVYAGNDLDRGHLVRRLDPAWGATVAIAKIANDDSFHFTNCTPQHARFNENKATWAGLEDYILYNADNADFKASVFTGPVFADDDDAYRDVKLPRQFWKVAVMVKGDGKLSATGYLLSQESLLTGLEVMLEEFSYGAYRTYQVPISQIEGLTGLSLGDLTSVDPLSGTEATGDEAVRSPREVSSPADLVL